MADYLDNYDDIVFLDSELDDDDDTAPVGELIKVVGRKGLPRKRPCGGGNSRCGESASR